MSKPGRLRTYLDLALAAREIARFPGVRSEISPPTDPTWDVDGTDGTNPRPKKWREEMKINVSKDDDDDDENCYRNSYINSGKMLK